MELPVVDRELEIRPPPIEKAAAEQSPSRGGIELPKDITPDRLRVPKALKHPERYRSPTDMMVSPITRGLIARTRRNGSALLPPPRLLIIDQPKKVDKEGDEANNGPQVLSGRVGSPVSSSSSPRTSDSDASDLFSDHEPAPHDRELDVGVPSGTPPRSPLMDASSPSMLERPAGYDPNRIPTSIFSSRPSNPADWSVASNESLFSIHTGNNSFSRDHTAFLLYKSGELTKLDEVFSVPTPLPTVSESLSLQRDSVSSSVAAKPLKLPKQYELSSEGNSPILGKSSGKGHLSPSGDARNSVSLSARSDGSATTTSTSSFAFPILAGSERNSSSLYTTDGAMERSKEAPSKTSQPQQQNHRTTVTAALSNCFSCFSCCSFRCNFSLK